MLLEMNTAVGALMDGRPNAVYVDDVGLTSVPEASSYAMLLAGLAWLRRPSSPRLIPGWRRGLDMQQGWQLPPLHCCSSPTRQGSTKEKPWGTAER